MEEECDSGDYKFVVEVKAATCSETIMMQRQKVAPLSGHGTGRNIPQGTFDRRAEKRQIRRL